MAERSVVSGMILVQMFALRGFAEVTVAQMSRHSRWSPAFTILRDSEGLSNFLVSRRPAHSRSSVQIRAVQPETILPQ